MREITNLIEADLVHVPPIHMLLLEDAAWAHEMIDTGHARGKLVLQLAGKGRGVQSLLVHQSPLSLISYYGKYPIHIPEITL
jgi:hypothetical protein